MRPKLLLLVITFISACPNAAFPQISANALGYYEDAARFSFTQMSGTARTQGMGGVQTALGADISSAHVNPGGLALYNRSEMGFSPSIHFASSTTDYTSPTESTISKAKTPRFNVSNFGIVFSGIDDTETDKKNKGGVFAISYNRINNFHQKFSYYGENHANSLRNYFTEVMDGTDEFVYANQELDYGGIIDLEGLAYWTWLSNNSSPTTYYTFDDGAPVSQREEIKRGGAQYQWDFSYGTNIDDKVYLGGGIGVVRSHFYEDKIYEEINLTTPVDGFESFRLNEEYSVRGTGINFTLGMIIRPSDPLRLGFSYQSPTYNSLKENWFAEIYANYSTGPAAPSVNRQTLESVYDYNLTTPAKINAGFAYFLGKSGFVSADLEYVSYNNAELNNKQKNSFTNFGLFDDDNETIIRNFKNQINLRVGGELRQDIYRLRGGFAYYSHPLAGIDDLNRNKTYITLGGGIKLPDYYLDIAIIRMAEKGLYSPYTLSSGNHPETNTDFSNILFTISWGTYF